MRANPSRRGQWMLSRTAGVAAIALVVALAGCTNLGGPPTSVALTEEQGFPVDAPFDEPEFGDTWAGEPIGWLSDDRSTITIVTYGSSGCTFIATAIDRIDERRVSIAFEQAPAEACSDDLAPRTHVLAAPAGLSDGTVIAEVSTRLSAFGNAEPRVKRLPLQTVETWSEGTSETIATHLEEQDGEDLPDRWPEPGEPFAYWADNRDSLRVVTYGSGSCPPPVLVLTAASASELEVVFGLGPDIPCTLDLAATIHVLQVPAGLSAGDITLTLITVQVDGTSTEQTTLVVD